MSRKLLKMDVGPGEGPGILRIPSRMRTEAYEAV